MMVNKTNNLEEEIKINDNIKTDLLNIINKFKMKMIDYPITKEFELHLYDQIYSWADRWNLNEFKFKITYEHNNIIIHPIKEIDKYTLIGILSL